MAEILEKAINAFPRSIFTTTKSLLASAKDLTEMTNVAAHPLNLPGVEAQNN